MKFINVLQAVGQCSRKFNKMVQILPVEQFKTEDKVAHIKSFAENFVAFCQSMNHESSSFVFAHIPIIISNDLNTAKVVSFVRRNRKTANTDTE